MDEHIPEERDFPNLHALDVPPLLLCSGSDDPVSNKVRRNDMKAKEVMLFCLVAIVAGLSSFFPLILVLLYM